MPPQDVSLTLRIPTPNEHSAGKRQEVTTGEWKLTVTILDALQGWNRETNPVVAVRLERISYSTNDYNLMVMHFYRRGWIVSPVKDMYRRVTVREAREGAW